MDELTLRVRVIVDKLTALKEALSTEQLEIYNQSLSESKKKVVDSISNNDSTLLQLIEELYR